jgi:hypothetical protein
VLSGTGCIKPEYRVAPNGKLRDKPSQFSVATALAGETRRQRTHALIDATNGAPQNAPGLLCLRLVTESPTGVDFKLQPPGHVAIQDGADTCERRQWLDLLTRSSPTELHRIVECPL